MSNNELSPALPTASAKKLPSLPAWLTQALWRLLPWLVLIALWSAVRLLGGKYTSLVPAPDLVLQKALSMIADGSLLQNWLASTLRVTGGVLLGVALAVPVGFSLGWFAAARQVLTPVINFFRALPPIALIPLMIIYVGIGDAAKLLVLVYASFFTAVVVMYEGISRTPQIYIHVARTLGASESELFRKVILPLSLPHILTATRVALGVGWMTLVASELISAENGLGSMIQLAASYFQLDVIYIGLITIGITAMVMDYLLVTLSARLVGWQEKVKP